MAVQAPHVKVRPKELKTRCFRCELLLKTP
jgi:hypothetical protein